MLDRLAWLGHASFVFEGPPRIYVDPFRLAGGPPADIVLITHSHYDHCSPRDLKAIVTAETTLVVTPDCVTVLQGLPGERKVLRAGASIEIDGVTIEAVPAYTRRSRLHGRENGWVGYIIEIDGFRWYHAGDTDFIPEMKQVRADIACLPVSGRTVMNPVEAAAAAKSIGPRVAIPMHYGATDGSVSDAELFRNLANVDVRILAHSVAADTNGDE